jgi:hypothetical protein
LPGSLADVGYPSQQIGDPPRTLLNITAASVAKSGSGFVFAVFGQCSLYDTNTTSGNVAANLIGTTAAASGFIQVNFAFGTGLLVVPTGAISVSFE